MRVGTIESSDVRNETFRLTGGFHLSEDQVAVQRLRKLRGKKEGLWDLCAGRRIFRGPIFKRVYAAGADYGVPYVSAKDLVKATIRPPSHLSRSHGALLDELRLEAGMILLTCSGMNLGSAIWTREDMDGLCGTHDLIRICPDPDRVPPGYLFAFLACRYGHAWIRKQIYGGNIKHIEPEHIRDLAIPRLGDAVENEISERILEASELRTRATRTLQEAEDSVLRAVGWDAGSLKRPMEKWSSSIRSQKFGPLRRLDALYYNPLASRIREWGAERGTEVDTLGGVADVWDVPPFKHYYVEPGYGPPFFTSGDLFKLGRHSDRCLSRSRTRGLDKYILESGWVMVARSGSLGGNIGRVQYSDETLAGSATSDHVIRIAAKANKVSSGYLFAYLSTETLGYALLLSSATGAVVPALWPTYLKHLPVVRSAPQVEATIHAKVESAFSDRTKSRSLERDAIRRLEAAIEGDV